MIYYVDFIGHYPIGANAIVVARDRGHAKRMLLNRLAEEGLAEKNEDMSLDDFVEVDTVSYGVSFVNNGDY